jgi:hypothetical protein
MFGELISFLMKVFSRSAVDDRVIGLVVDVAVSR